MPIGSGETESRTSGYLRWFLEKAGIVLMAASVFVLYLTFEPVIKEELAYAFSDREAATPVLTRAEAAAATASEAPVEKAIYPVDEHSGIVIPKIGANAKVVWGVDWQDSSVYQRALTKGVAHAKGTALPGEPGNVFLFAHSGADFYEAIRYNAEFYLLSKLEAGDEVYLFRDGKKLAYRVTDTRTVSPEEVGYLSGDAKKKTLTLMTCWPAGTTYKRLVVLADQVSE